MPDPSQANFLGTNYPAPTDPNYYLSQTGLSSLVPQAFNADTLAAMFAPQGMQFTPYNSLATNPFLSQFMQGQAQGLLNQRPKNPNDVPPQSQQQTQGGY